MRSWPRRLVATPEFQLGLIGLPLSLLWEVAQFPLYTVWHEEPPASVLFALMHCTVGDLLILLACHTAVAVVLRDRHWVERHALFGGALFVVLGAAYTVASERVNVNVRGAWAYTELMPLVPGLDIGLTPFLQWLLVPPTTLWLLRLLRGGGLQRSP